ncbi:MAG TPA: hypothetical protein VFT50_09315 [Baekduia sp.]|nr:hypothetical protein [Baekduia sp.]
MDATQFDFDAAAFEALPPDRRRRAIAAMAQMSGDIKTNPLWRFDPLNPRGSGVPHLPQHRFLKSWKTPDGRLRKFGLLPGGNRGGKTTTGDVGDIIDLIDREAVPPHLQAYKRWDGPIDMYLVAVSQRAVERIHLPIFRQWCPKSQLVGNSVDKAYNKEFSTIHFKNGSTCAFMTQKMEMEVFQGTPLHIVHFDEEPLYDHGLEIFTECMQRLVDFNGDMRMTFTPLNGMTWVYDKLYLPWEREQPDGEAAVEGWADVEFNGYRFPLYCHVVDQDDNPVIDDEGKAAAMAMARNDEERLARKSGRFVSFAGKIYSGFAQTRHVVPEQEVLARFHAPATQMILGGLDPGFRHMAGVLWVALDHDGVWVGPELGLKEVIIPLVCREILLVEERLQLRRTIFMADPAIAKRDAQTGKTDQQAYLENGVYTRPANNQVRPGINAIRNLLAADRLHISAGCVQLLEQFNRYRWISTGRSEDAAPERPVKRDDHLLDALRYAVMALPIPEVAPVEDQRTHLERLLAQDIALAQARAAEPAQGHMTIGVGQWD